eukprot:snap_masked-scaffold_11-processed-gene-6.49-mRNA-1 protein AED:1.00 eAED:1.00 QI:0/0/0/0/1/1/2/0/87
MFEKILLLSATTKGTKLQIKHSLFNQKFFTKKEEKRHAAKVEELGLLPTKWHRIGVRTTDFHAYGIGYSYTWLLTTRNTRTSVHKLF